MPLGRLLLPFSLHERKRLFMSVHLARPSSYSAIFNHTNIWSYRFYDQESVSQEKTLTTNNSVIHTMPPNTQDCRPTFVFVVSVVELMVTKSQAY